MEPWDGELEEGKEEDPLIFDLVGALWQAGTSLMGLLFLVLLLGAAVKVVPEYQRAVVFRLGRLVGAKGPGLILVIPGGGPDSSGWTCGW